MAPSSDRLEKLDSPLGRATPRSWAATALVDPLALLNDHAHLERKAASNALELLAEEARVITLMPEGPAMHSWPREPART